MVRADGANHYTNLGSYNMIVKAKTLHSNNMFTSNPINWEDQYSFDTTTIQLIIPTGARTTEKIAGELNAVMWGGMFKGP